MTLQHDFLKRTLCAAGLLLAAVVFLPASSANAQEDADWDITIRYLKEPAAPAVEKNGLTYEQAYNAIPFNRAEYDANPSYRHDSAMELLFNQMRPTTIIRSQSSHSSKYPVFNYPNYQWSHSHYYSYPSFYYRSLYPR